MACQFTFPFSGAADQVLQKARRAVEGQGGQFNGTADAGDFKVSVFGNTVAGTYRVLGTDLHIDITDKPFLIPCSAIEGFLKSQVTG